METKKAERQVDLPLRLIKFLAIKFEFFGGLLL
jgi:hypothetical protein